MKFLAGIRKIVDSLTERGPRATLELINHNLIYHLRPYLDRSFDRKFKVDTNKTAELADLTIDSDNKQFGVHYEPTSVKFLKSIFSSLPGDVSDFVFVDFGSGKGRTLLVASDYNFKKIVGIEFSEELHRIAENNIRVYRSKKQRCHDIESVHMDATTYPIPDQQSIFYFYHPFQKEVMSQVLDNIKKSYLENQRKIFIIYYQQSLLLSPLIENLGFFRRIETNPLPVDLSNRYRRGLFERSSPYRTGLAMYESIP